MRFKTPARWATTAAAAIAKQSLLNFNEAVTSFTSFTFTSFTFLTFFPTTVALIYSVLAFEFLKLSLALSLSL